MEVKKTIEHSITYTIHRGSNEIGGNCVELKAGNTKIIIDCGLPLNYDEQDQETQNKIHVDAQQWMQNCDAILLSHYHADHYGLLSEAPKGTKLYTSKETADLMTLSGIFGEDLTQHLDIRPLEGSIKVKDFTITIYPVDHSAYGASAFLLEVDNTSFLYSGDLRLHGKKGVLTYRLPQNIDYLILEGTNIGRCSSSKTEKDIENEFIEEFKAHPDTIPLVWCSSQNIDRIVALYRACRQSRRILAIDPYTALVIGITNRSHSSIPTAKTHSELLIYYPHLLTTLLNKKDKKYIIDPYLKEKKLNTQTLMTHPGRFVLLFRPGLLDFAETYLENNTVRVITSIWNEYWNTSKKDVLKLKNWIAAAPDKRSIGPDIHTSGHADTESLQKIVNHIHPKHIIPIHTEHPESYETLFPGIPVLIANKTL